MRKLIFYISIHTTQMFSLGMFCHVIVLFGRHKSKYWIFLVDKSNISRPVKFNAVISCRNFVTHIASSSSVDFLVDIISTFRLKNKNFQVRWKRTLYQKGYCFPVCCSGELIRKGRDRSGPLSLLDATFLHPFLSEIVKKF